MILDEEHHFRSAEQLIAHDGDAHHQRDDANHRVSQRYGRNAALRRLGFPHFLDGAALKIFPKRAVGLFRMESLGEFGFQALGLFPEGLLQKGRVFVFLLIARVHAPKESRQYRRDRRREHDAENDIKQNGICHVFGFL